MGFVLEVYDNLFYKTYGFRPPISGKLGGIAKRIADAVPSQSEQRAVVVRFFQMDDFAIKQSRHDIALLLGQLHKIRCEVKGAPACRTPLEINLRGQNEKIMDLVWGSRLRS